MSHSSIHVLYEDNHLIVLNKSVSDLTQKDKTGDTSLDEKLKAYLKQKYNKPGNVFVGIPHRLDRPVSGIVVYAKTSKALSRLSVMFRDKEIKKTYWAIVQNKPNPTAAEITHHLVRNTKQNKSYANDKKVKNSKEAILQYNTIAKSERYFLLSINLITGRHHQIRCQLAKIGCPIKGDLKYGFSTSNKDGGISLHSREITFIHPVKKEKINIVAPVPEDNLWKSFEKDFS